MKYTHNNYSVFAGKTEIARLYIDWPHDELRVLQGMPRMETVQKIIDDCPDFAKANGIDGTKSPMLFAACTKNRKR